MEYLIPLSVVAMLVLYLGFSFRRNSYRTRNLASEFVRAEIAAYDKDDPRYQKITHRQALVGFCLGVIFLALDIFFGFPGLADHGGLLGRGTYLVVLFWSSIVLFLDHRAARKRK